MSELVSVLSGWGNEALAFKSISSLTGLMVKQASSIIIFTMPSAVTFCQILVFFGQHLPFLTFVEAVMKASTFPPVLHVSSDFLLCAMAETQWH